jgi:trehalose 6-phosphate phosphatase
VARILDNLEVLQKIIIRTPFGLITDIDGTIAPTIPNILQAEITAINRHCLSILSKKLALVAVISGRQSREVKDMVNAEGVICIGHYGMEYWQNNKAILHPDAETYVPAIRALVKELESLKSIEGIVIQDKWATVSVFYRQSPDKQSARKAILNLLKNSLNAKVLRILDEKMVIGVVPPVDIDKGTAVANLIRQHQLRGAIFLGDDTGDVPAFRAIHLARQNRNFNGLAILVTGKETQHNINAETDFTLDGVQETETLLKWLIDN